MNIKKLITTAFLMSLANHSYGQELAYLHCIGFVSEGRSFKESDRILVLNDETRKWGSFTLYEDEQLETALSYSNVIRRRQVVSGKLDLRILFITSENYRLEVIVDKYYWDLSRITGELRSMDSSHFLDCLPLDKTEVESFIQEQVDQRDEIIRANEAKRLF